MAGVLFRVYVPTSQYEGRLRENLKNKNKPSPDSCEVTIDKVDADNNCVKESEETKRLLTVDENELSKSPTVPSDISEMGNKVAEVNNDDSRNQIQKPKLKLDTKKTKSLEDIPKKSTELTVETEELALEKALRKVLKSMNIINAMWCQTNDANFFQVIFTMEADSGCEETLQQLQEYGIGSKWSSVVSVIPCSLHYQSMDDEGMDKAAEGGLEQGDDQRDTVEMSEWDNFLASIRSRLTVAEVVQGVKAGASLTFDFIALLLVAGFLSALGLVENSTVVLVASMLISPLMGPILAGTLGTMIADRYLQKMGIRNELLGLLTCLIIGFLFGCAIGLSTDKWGDGEWPTEEMTSRGKVRSLWVGLLIALFSGAGVAISTLADYTGSLVGVAISASLLPPAVNAGLLWGLAFMDVISGWDSNDNSTNPPLYTYVYSEHRPSDLAILGTVSMGLTLLNIVCIFIMGILVLKVKAVAPRTTKEQQKFWKHDVKVAKDYNWTWNGEDARELGRRLVIEHSGRSFDGAIGKQRGSLEKLNSATDGDQMTWSPNTKDIHAKEFPSVHELEVLYRTLASANRKTPPRLFLRQMSEGSWRPSGTPTSPPPQMMNFGQPIFSANTSLETVPEDRAIMSLEPPRRPQRYRSARFVVSPAEDPVINL
ncbi:uncharacterized protein [Anabrus simplex]|uniref:uncharacterized protein isoform X1 n=1 Tax=Anabrus simplex TaxID=316456 RepID=UPI0035A3BDDF